MDSSYIIIMKDALCLHINYAIAAMVSLEELAIIARFCGCYFLVPQLQGLLSFTEAGNILQGHVAIVY